MARRGTRVMKDEENDVREAIESARRRGCVSHYEPGSDEHEQREEKSIKRERGEARSRRGGREHDASCARA